MNGQGRPIDERENGRGATWNGSRSRGRLLACLLLTFAALVGFEGDATAADRQYRLHIAWGGSAPRRWQGRIFLQQGSLQNVSPLGFDPDAPGSYIEQAQQILIAPSLPHRYDGLTCLLKADDADTLTIELVPDDEPDEIRRLTIPVRQLSTEPQVLKLDDASSQLTVKRATGDLLQFETPRDHLVFYPRDNWTFQIRGNHLNVKPETSLKLRLKIRRLHAKPRTDVTDLWTTPEEPWTQEIPLRVDAAGNTESIAFDEVPIPRDAGVYSLDIELSAKRNLVVPFRTAPTMATRNIQFVVVSERPESTVANERNAVLVAEFNPADPSWLDQLPPIPQLRLGRSSKRHWSSHEHDVWTSDGRAWTKVRSEGWIAYALPVDRVGAAHVVDLELPAELRQRVGISLVEPNAAGDLEPIGLDSGIEVGDGDLDLPRVSVPSEPSHHRLVFWPRTTSPILLITNRNQQGSIAFGRIRTEAFPDGLPPLEPVKSRGRKRLAFLERPLMNKNFSAPAAADEQTTISLDDWQSHYRAGRRLIEYLRYAGYDGAIVTVAAEGSALYPSDLLNPTPQYDPGVFSSHGRDPIRKDIFEMLLRMFDAAGLVLIPSIEFATPLPQLEQLRAGRSLAARGSWPSFGSTIEMQTEAGLNWETVHSQQPGEAPYYNPIQPDVQRAIQQVIEELATRYSDHPSLGGLNLNLNVDGFAHFRGVDWGLDAGTLHEFRQTLPIPNITLDQLRTEIVRRNPELTPQWLLWRARKITRFYEQLATVARQYTGGPLFISTAPLIDSQPWQEHLRPRLTEPLRPEQAMLELGLQARELAQHPGIVLLRPNQIAPLRSLARQAVSLSVERAEEVDQHFADAATAGVQFSRVPQQIYLDSFGDIGLFNRATPLFLSQFELGGSTARRPFAHSLASVDQQWIVDGGPLLPMGQEQHLNRFFQVFRQLPAESFQTLPLETNRSVIVRTWSDNDRQISYLVNDAPWPVQVELDYRSSTETKPRSLGKLEFDSSAMADDKSSLRFTVEAYGLAAFEFDTPDVRLLDCRTKYPDGVENELAVQIDVIARLNKQVGSPEPLRVLPNASFEHSTDTHSPVGWQITARQTGRVMLDRQIAADGKASLHLSSQGGSAAVTSSPFPAPETGFLLLAVKLRSTGATQPPVALRIESNNPNYQPFHHVQKRITPEFAVFPLRVDDIPASPDLELKIRFELMGPGDLWIDDVQLYDKWFVPKEQRALDKILQSAYTLKYNGNLRGCYYTLSGYWPRFLLRHITPLEVAARPAKPLPQPPPEKPSRNMLDRIRRFVPRGFRF